MAAEQWLGENIVEMAEIPDRKQFTNYPHAVSPLSNGKAASGVLVCLRTECYVRVLV